MGAFDSGEPSDGGVRLQGRFIGQTVPTTELGGLQGLEMESFRGNQENGFQYCGFHGSSLVGKHHSCLFVLEPDNKSLSGRLRLTLDKNKQIKLQEAFLWDQ